MRTKVALAGFAAAALGLTACSTAPSETDPTESTDALTIGTTSNNQEPMEAVVDVYREETGLDINVTIADTSQYQTTLRTQLNAGTGPDVFTVWAGGGNPGAIEVLQGAGYLADLSDREWVDDVDPDTAETLQIDGKTYGLPSKLDAIGAIYNKGALEETGLSIPQSYTDLLGFCEDAQDAGKTAFALGIQTDWVTQLIAYALVANNLYGEDPDFDAKLQDGAAAFSGSGWEVALNKYLEMNDAGCFNSDPLGTDVTASYDLVNSGDAIAVVQVLASYPQIASTAEEGTEYGFFALPGDDSGINRIPRGIGVSFAVNEDATNKANALDFVDWLASRQATDAWFNAAPGLPAISETEVELDEVMATALDIVDDGDTAPMPDQAWPNAKPQSALFIGVQELFSSQADVSDVLQAMDDSLQG